MILNTRKKIANYLQISEETLREIAPALPILGIGEKKYAYTTGSNYLEFIQKRISSLTSGDFDSVQSLVQSNRKNFLLDNIDALYKKNSNECITIAFNNLKGGVAKTTTVANLGAILAALNQKVLLVDMDMQNQLSTFFTKEIAFDANTKEIDNMSEDEIDFLCDIISREKYAEKSILTVIKDFADNKILNYDLVDEVITTVDIGLENKTLDILPSEWRLGRGLETARSIPNVSILLRKILKRAKEKYDFILIDTSPANMLSIELSFYASDYISLVSTPDQKAFQSFSNIIEELELLKKDVEEFKLDIKLDSLILSRTVENSNSQKFWKKMYKNKTKMKNLHIFLVPQKELFSSAETKNKPLISYGEKRSEALETISELGDYAISLINRKGK
ncbi:MAG: AAA family ATPase [Sulfurimonas sp.]|uniref:AAA family ATPase n=1 Tax=Sulfurimonas sp. TaxID=2022749 RepID=UPI002614D738|nr:AAA family ATPase [Sulfurimonas sp.]MDD5373283.1 AAA family ATPase [Sulfurimonas sp.]